MCLAQGPQRSDAGEVRSRGPSVSSQALIITIIIGNYNMCPPIYTMDHPDLTYADCIKLYGKSIGTLGLQSHSISRR